MSIAVQLTDDQIAVLGCAIVFGGCLVVMLISQKIGEKVRGTSRRSSSNTVPFRVSRDESKSDRRAA